jgi:hypothetical protein
VARRDYAFDPAMTAYNIAEFRDDRRYRDGVAAIPG